MKFVALLMFALLVPLLIPLYSEDPQINKAKSEGYGLVWKDEFETDGPFDRTKWAWEKGFVRNQKLSSIVTANS
jgi:hypothetical protein